MGCSSSKQQQIINQAIKNFSERTNATSNDSERTFSERTYCDKVNPSAMMTTATGEVTKIETAKPSGRLSPTQRTNTQRTSTSRTPTQRTPTQRTSTSRTPTQRTPTQRTSTSRTPTQRSSAATHTQSSNAKTSSTENSKHCRDQKPPLVVRRGSKIDRSAKALVGSLDLDSSSNHSSRSVSEHSAVMFKANCDRQSLAEALETFDIDIEDFSSHTHSTSNYEDPQICIVRSDKLAFQGAGIRRHSRRKRHRQLGKDNTKIVIVRQPSFREQALLAAAEAEAVEIKHKLEDECSMHRSERRLSRANARNDRGAKTNSTPINSRRRNDGVIKPRQRVSMPASSATKRTADLDGTPIRSNSVLRIGSSKEISGVMMFEDKSEDLDIWPMPITA